MCHFTESVSDLKLYQVSIVFDNSYKNPTKFVFRFHPHFPNIMRSRIAQLMGVEYKFDLMLSTDGSGRGAALVAAVLQNQQVNCAPF